jgi:hypothetical protein
VKQFDNLFRTNQDQEDYEKGLSNARKCVLGKGDSYTIVGGGHGITAIKASGTADHIVVYEASSEQTKIIRENLELNEVVNVDVRNAIVGQIEYQEDEKFREVPSIQPNEITTTSCLELDCEGAEQKIFDNLGFQLKKLIVEFHPFHNDNCGVEFFDELKNIYNLVHCFGHDGEKINEKTARTLLKESTKIPKTFSDGARTPVVAGFKK